MKREDIISVTHLECEVFLYSFCADFRAEVQNKLHRDQDYPCEVVGSWNTWYGEQDQAGTVHSNALVK